MIDAQVARRQDPELKRLLDQFVCVRAVQFFDVDLRQYQCDFDQSWHVFLMNADGTIYGRYGTRSSSEAHENTVEGLNKALARALELHADFPRNKPDLAGKKGPPPPVRSTDDFVAFRGRFTTSAVGRNCFHCHNATEGYRGEVRRARKPLPDELMYPYPMPDLLGLHMDLKECATVAAVDAGSVAEKGGFRKGDRIVKIEGQPPISLADVQWVLQQAKTPSIVKCDVDRADGTPAMTSLALEPGWRKYDILWRPSTNPMQPGFGTDEATQAERDKLGVDAKSLALRVRGIFKNGPATGSGLAAGDFIVSVDGRRDVTNKLEFIVYCQQQKLSGDKIELTLGGAKKKRKIEIELP